MNTAAASVEMEDQLELLIDDDGTVPVRVDRAC